MHIDSIMMTTYEPRSIQEFAQYTPITNAPLNTTDDEEYIDIFYDSDPPEHDLIAQSKVRDDPLARFKAIDKRVF